MARSTYRSLLCASLVGLSAALPGDSLFRRGGPNRRPQAEHQADHAGPPQGGPPQGSNDDHHGHPQGNPVQESSDGQLVSYISYGINNHPGNEATVVTTTLTSAPSSAETPSSTLIESTTLSNLSTTLTASSSTFVSSTDSASTSPSSTSISSTDSTSMSASSTYVASTNSSSIYVASTVSASESASSTYVDATSASSASASSTSASSTDSAAAEASSTYAESTDAAATVDAPSYAASQEATSTFVADTGAASAGTATDAASTTLNAGNGGVLSIPTGSTTPDQSLLATRQQCEALMDDQLPPPNSIPSNFTFSGNVRTYYVTAEQVSWNYAPSGWDNWLGVPLQQSPRAAAAGYTNAGGSLGGEGGFLWEKAQYKGYTDSSFTTEVEKPATDGINGPTLRAEVNDMIQILFVNKLTDHYATMHSMGMYYGKQFEGSLYPNTTTGESPPVQEQDAVPPGGCAVYKWIATQSQAPTPGQNSRLWSYHSYVNMPAETSAGLVGAIIVYNPGTMTDTMASNREFVLNMMTTFEAQSIFAQTNAERYGGLTNLPTINQLIGGPHQGNESFWVPQLTNFPSVQLGFKQAPIFYTMNGYVMGNAPAYEMCRDDPVIWYVMAYGQDSHVFHMHGNDFQYLGQWLATQSINVGEMYTFNMNAQLPGVWQVICHVAQHLAFGMHGSYVVYEDKFGEDNCPLAPLTAKLQGSP